MAICLLYTSQYGFRQSDARTDIYGLGILLNFMLTSCHPQQLAACGPIARIIEICTHIDPDKRYDCLLYTSRCG